MSQSCQGGACYNSRPRGSRQQQKATSLESITSQSIIGAGANLLGIVAQTTETHTSSIVEAQAPHESANDASLRKGRKIINRKLMPARPPGNWIEYKRHAGFSATDAKDALVGNPVCVLCDEPINTDEFITTLCGHQFHTVCLKRCEFAGCPLCGETMLYPSRIVLHDRMLTRSDIQACPPRGADVAITSVHEQRQLAAQTSETWENESEGSSSNVGFEMSTQWAYVSREREDEASAASP